MGLTYHSFVISNIFKPSFFILAAWTSGILDHFEVRFWKGSLSLKHRNSQSIHQLSKATFTPLKIYSQSDQLRISTKLTDQNQSNKFNHETSVKLEQKLIGAAAAARLAPLVQN